MSRAVGVLSCLLTALFLLVAAPAGSAAAHEFVLSTTPVAGDRLDTVPDAVSVTLSGPLLAGAPVALAVTAVDGRSVVRGEPSTGPDRRTVTVGVDLGPAPAGYLVTFAAVSDQNHPVATSFSFTVGQPRTSVTSTGAPLGTAGADPTVSALGVVATALGHLGLVLAGGLVLVRVGGAPSTPRARTVVVGGALVLAAATAAALALHGPTITSAGPDALGDPTSWASALRVPHGRLLLLRLVAALALAAAAAALLSPRHQNPLRPRRGHRAENIAIAAGGVLLLSFAATGPLVDDAGGPITMIVTGLHVGAAAVWLGALTMGAVTGVGATTPPGRALAQLTALHTVAGRALAVAAASGVYLAWRAIGGVDGLLGTAYGAVLLVASTLLIAVLAAATRVREALHRHRAVLAPTGPPLPAASDRPVDGPTAVLTVVRRGLAAQLALGAALLLVLTPLAALAPPGP